VSVKNNKYGRNIIYIIVLLIYHIYCLIYGSPRPQPTGGACLPHAQEIPALENTAQSVNSHLVKRVDGYV